MDKRRMTVASCVALAFGMTGSACAVFSGAPAGMSEEPQDPLRLSFEELSEPVLAYLSEEKTVEELVERWGAATSEKENPTERNCHQDSMALVYDAVSNCLQDLEDVDRDYRDYALEDYRLIGNTRAISGEPELIEELHQKLGDVQVYLGN